MTIVFQGHIERVEWSPPKSILVTVHAQTDVCEHPILLRVAEKDATHWLVGRMVSITAYAFDAPKPEEPTP